MREPGNLDEMLHLYPSYRRASSLRGRRLKGKGKGVFGKGVLGARETRGAREGELPFPSLSNACHAGYRASYLAEKEKK